MAKNNSATSGAATQAEQDHTAQEAKAEPVAVNAPPAEPEIKGEEKPDGCAAGFYCYIGPSIKGLIWHGTIYRGTRSDALKAAAAAIEKQPLVKTLIVSGDDLPEARLKIKKPGNALYRNYRKIAGKQ